MGGYGVGGSVDPTEGVENQAPVGRSKRPLSTLWAMPRERVFARLAHVASSASTMLALSRAGLASKCLTLPCVALRGIPICW